MNYIFIGDLVTVPEQKVVGTVHDKIYVMDQNEIIIRIRPDGQWTRRIYPENKSYLYSIIYSDYSKVKSLVSKNIYKGRVSDQKIPSLQIPNLLKNKDIVKGTIVRIVDNCLLERIVTYKECDLPFDNMYMGGLIHCEIVLTGRRRKLSNGELMVEYGSKYNTKYMYIHSLQLVKRAKFIYRLSGFFVNYYHLIVDRHLFKEIST